MGSLTTVLKCIKSLKSLESLYGIENSKHLEYNLLVRKTNFVKIVFVCIGCTISFTLRAFLDLLSVYYTLTDIENNTGDVKQWSGPWGLYFAFYFFFETVPVAMMLFLLRKIPKEASSETRPLL